jgi:hypothetical protein
MLVFLDVLIIEFLALNSSALFDLSTGLFVVAIEAGDTQTA